MLILHLLNLWYLPKVIKSTIDTPCLYSMEYVLILKLIMLWFQKIMYHL